MQETIEIDCPGRTVFLNGNEAFARGAIEAGVQFAASYPGSPTAQVLEQIKLVSEKFNIYCEWSINEKLAAEAAAGAALSGVRALAVMKCDGLNVASDFLTSLSPTGVEAGMVIMVGDDPGAHSSAKEEDCRLFAKLAHIPVLEPADVVEIPEIMKYAFKLSETFKHPVIVRSVTRTCHASASVKLGHFERHEIKPRIDPESKYIAWIEKHRRQENVIKQAEKLAEINHFNAYTGPKKPAVLVITAGPSYHYALEAVELMNLSSRVGILKLVSIWPLPNELLTKYLKSSDTVIFFEEIEPFIEEHVQSLSARNQSLDKKEFFGRLSDDWTGSTGIALGETSPDVIKKALAHALNIYNPNPHKKSKLKLPEREITLCPGCPHRASFWAIKSALKLDGRDGLVMGDIGCYTLGKGRTGFSILNSMHCMGSGLGLANGLGQLEKLFDFKQPVVAVVGDSTLYHASIPALINAQYHDAHFLCVILDNNTTAMTGHQPHPGIEDASSAGSSLPIEDVLDTLKIPRKTCDPYEIEKSRDAIFDMLNLEKTGAIIMRRDCVLNTDSHNSKKVWVDSNRCIGKECGCSLFCSETFSCPANIFDEKEDKVYIDQQLCTGCEVCAALCPEEAIIVTYEEEER